MWKGIGVVKGVLMCDGMSVTLGGMKREMRMKKSGFNRRRESYIIAGTKEGKEVR